MSIDEQVSEQSPPWFEAVVTIEITTEEKAVIKIDRRDFEEWAGSVPPADLDANVEEFLRGGEEWEVCSEVHDAARETGIVDCEITRVHTRPAGGADDA